MRENFVPETSQVVASESQTEDKVSIETTKEEKKPSKIKTIFLFSALVFILLATYFVYKFVDFENVNIGSSPESADYNLVKFENEAEYLAYFEEVETMVGGLSVGVFGPIEVMTRESADYSDVKELAPGGNFSATAQRMSGTNVQVAGIDEPDIVKTDGKNIFMSLQDKLYPFLRGESVPLPRPDEEFDFGMEEQIEAVEVSDQVSPDYPINLGVTNIVKAFPPESLSKLSKIDLSGELLLYGKTLVVISGNDLVGFDVSDEEKPTEVWKIDFDDRQEIISTRLFKGEIYVITRTFSTSFTGCNVPYKNGVEILCTDVYHPTISVPVDSIYTVSKISATDGTIGDKMSFVGASGLSTIYMHPEKLFVTYTTYPDLLKYFYGFFEDEGKDLVTSNFRNELEKVKDLDISTQAKMTEFSVLIENFILSLSSDEVLRFETELQNKMNSYSSRHARELEETGIVSIDVSSLEFQASGKVAGHPLNQFSLDYYENHLRVATTIGTSSGISNESVNDLYVLDSEMKTVGEVLGFAPDEKIYSARFVGERGYLVTFKEIDPFFVFDLTDPKNPKLTGELKIPGYSSYLHPISENLIMGVGKEDNFVKISLFDVTDSASPKEISKYELREYWSDILNTHHAFLNDETHKFVFIPGGNGGYVLSYEGNELTLEKAISTNGVRRALYLDDYLYVISDSKIQVYDENSWEEISTLNL